MSTVRTRSFSITNDLANGILIRALKSKAGRRLGKRLAVLEYTGRRSGMPYQLVTHSVVAGGTVRIRVGMPQRKTWWRNFQSAHPVRLWLAGESHLATGHVERDRGRVFVVVEMQPVQ
jgi:hypothetical protein